MVDNNDNPTTGDGNNEEEEDENTRIMINSTLIEFLYTFPIISIEQQHQLNDTTIIEELSDGVVLFEALSEISPEYFDPTTIARHLGDNWALKNSNLRKLVRNLEQYYHQVLKRDYSYWNTIDIANVARYHHRKPVITLCQLLIAAAVTCPQKQIFVQRIMSMSSESQVIMKDLIQQSLQQITTYINPDDEDNTDEGGKHNDLNNTTDHSKNGNDDDGDDDDENELVFDGNQNDDIDDSYGGSSNANEQMYQPTKLFHSAKSKRRTTGGADDLQQYEDVVKELESLKLQLTINTEEYQKSEKKLSAIIEDLQDRLMKRQDELIEVEEELKESVAELEETKSKLVTIEEEKAVLEDDLDVMKSKAQQLYKAEATLMAYKKKIDSMGTMNQQMEDLEGQAEKYLRQIMTLESEVKKSTSLQRTVTTQEEMIQKLEKTIAEQASTMKGTMSEIAELKSRLSATENSKKIYEDELNELRMKQQHLLSELEQVQQPSQVSDSNSTSGVAGTMTSDQREKMMRLEIENQQLREQLAASSQMDVSSTTTPTGKASLTPDTTTPIAVAVPTTTTSSDTIIEGLKLEIQRLTDAYAAKELENTKIASDKDKLEAYTKRTLAKFQDKYLVALQECKAKLKEKQDKIELLEKRSQTERNTQKREERLLSSAIYELGLGIMQNKLKGNTTSLTASSISSNTPTKM